MGYSAGEIIMVNFVILNSKSLPFRNKYVFKHIKNFSDGFRMYFEEKGDIITICYFGSHLSTKRYK